MNLPTQAAPVFRQMNRLASQTMGVLPSARQIPSPIGIALRELGKQIGDFDGNVMCAMAIYSVLDNYDRCLAAPGNTEKGCALNAARFIAGPLCDTYCSSLCQVVRPSSL